ncbi:MAG TPA: bifunctional ADP-heptose synthase [bacterium]|nr:bifunctional ADP-heptose synthase [bacterium]
MTLVMRPERLGEILAGMKGKRVLVLGDLIADEYIYGETSRVSREAPVLIIRHVGRRVIPGGAGNAVLNLAALGALPEPASVVGADEPAREVLAELAARGIDPAGVRLDSARRTIRKTRVMAGGAHGQKQQVMRIDQEEHVPLDDETEGDLLRVASDALRRVDAVLFSDYGYGTIGERVREWVIGQARRRGIPVCADSRYELRTFAGVTFATPNEQEAESAWGRPIRSPEDLQAASAALTEQLDADFVLLTRGQDGMAVSERNGAFHEIPIWGETEAADVTGAGDTVAAAALLAIASGAAPREAAELATVAAGIVVQKHGAATTTPEEIERFAGIPREAAQP